MGRWETFGREILSVTLTTSEKSRTNESACCCDATVAREKASADSLVDLPTTTIDSSGQTNFACAAIFAKTIGTFGGSNLRLNRVKLLIVVPTQNGTVMCVFSGGGTCISVDGEDPGAENWRGEHNSVKLFHVL